MSGDGSILRTDGLHKFFGGVHAVDDVSIEVTDGEILSIIGPNGAGKTTLFNLITGVHDASEGSAEFLVDGDWTQVTGRPPHAIAELGLVRTWQNVRPFGGLTTRENVLAGLGHDRYRSASMFGRYDRETHEATADDLLERVGMDEYADTPASSLPLALQRRVEIARALALDPELLLLDEPAAGLNKEESEELMALLRDLVEEGLTIVLIEHAMDVVMNVSDRIYVLDQGSIIAEGSPIEIQNDERVVEAYFGESETAEIEGGVGDA
ncbi:MAG: branched-chain amino acid transport system ATP-binding protein [Halobacteriales archaeon]|jgi:branched-chain amino acid transport system ATP-binding protein